MGRLFHENISIIFRRGALEVMKREEFLKQLEQLLDGISEEEKADALAFYRSYFEDAGEENEESVIAELESPEKVAQSIRKKRMDLMACRRIKIRSGIRTMMICL